MLLPAIRFSYCALRFFSSSIFLSAALSLNNFSSSLLCFFSLWVYESPNLSTSFRSLNLILAITGTFCLKADFATTAYPESAPVPAFDGPSVLSAIISVEFIKPVTLYVCRFSCSGTPLFSANSMLLPILYFPLYLSVSAISSCRFGSLPLTTSNFDILRGAEYMRIEDEDFAIVVSVKFPNSTSLTPCASLISFSSAAPKP